VSGRRTNGVQGAIRPRALERMGVRPQVAETASGVSLGIGAAACVGIRPGPKTARITGGDSTRLLPDRKDNRDAASGAPPMAPARPVLQMSAMSPEGSSRVVGAKAWALPAQGSASLASELFPDDLESAVARDARAAEHRGVGDARAALRVPGRGQGRRDRSPAAEPRWSWCAIAGPWQAGRPAASFQRRALRAPDAWHWAVSGRPRWMSGAHGSSGRAWRSAAASFVSSGPRSTSPPPRLA
jgi:hypothetical protein